MALSPDMQALVDSGEISYELALQMQAEDQQHAYQSGFSSERTGISRSNSHVEPSGRVQSHGQIPSRSPSHHSAVGGHPHGHGAPASTPAAHSSSYPTPQQRPAAHGPATTPAAHTAHGPATTPAAHATSPTTPHTMGGSPMATAMSSGMGGFGAHSHSPAGKAGYSNAGSAIPSRTNTKTDGYPAAHGLQSRNSSRHSTLNQQLDPMRSHMTTAGRVSALVGCKLKAYIFGANNLKNTDLGILPGDVSDPFLVARLGKREMDSNGALKLFKPGRQEFKTEVIDNDLNPRWRSNHFEFSIESGDEDVLRMEVYNCNQYHHDSLGFVEIGLDNPRFVGQTMRFREHLETGDDATLEFELRLLTPEQVARGDVGGPPPMAIGDVGGSSKLQPAPKPSNDVLAKPIHHYNHLTPDHTSALAVSRMQRHSVQHKVPLPSFKDQGPAAFEVPPPPKQRAEVGERRKKMEYASKACHLGQYDYNSEPVYYPRQDIASVDKHEWQADPFYGWRNDEESLGDAPRRSTLSGRNRDGHQEVQLWSSDPFHGWLKHTKDGKPKLDEKEEKAKMMRELANDDNRNLQRLPSFSDADKKRFDDHREYVAMHKIDTRHRQKPRVEQPEHKWRDDAFWGWLPDRGVEDAVEHLLHRPFQAARLKNCPSFAEQALSGLKGRGVGVLKIWVRSATGLTHAGNRGIPDEAEVEVKVKSSRGQIYRRTSTQPVEAEAQYQGSTWQWQGHRGMFTFEIENEDDAVEFEVLERKHKLPNGTHVQEHKLGYCVLSMVDVIRQFEAKAKNGDPNDKVDKSERLQQAHDGKLHFSFQFEPYVKEQGELGSGNDAVYDMERRRAMMHATNQSQQHGGQSGLRTQAPPEKYQTRGGQNLQRGQSWSSQQQGRGMGVLSVRIIRAFNLINTDSGILGDVSDPYVTLKLSSEREQKKPKRTATVKNNLNPTWNSDPFLFNIESELDSLELHVFDDDHDQMFGGRDDFIGSMTIPLEQIVRQAGKPIRLKDRLQGVDSGELEVEIGFVVG